MALGCGGDGTSAPTPPASTPSSEEPPSSALTPSTTGATTSTTESLPEVTGPFAPGRTRLPGFGEVEVRIVPGPDGEPIILCVLLAETPEQRSRGLMGVTDPQLGGYDGMLFVMEEDTTGGFWMKDTLLPLSLAYLDADGATVDVEDMEPCGDQDPCPGYPPSGPYRSALEVPQGGLAELGLAPGAPARLQVTGACRPPP